MFMKKFLTVIMIFSLALLSLAGCSSSEKKNTDAGSASNAQEPKEAKVRTIRAGIGLTETHPEYKALLKWKELVEEKTKGTIKVETFPSGQMGDDRTMTENLQMGTLEVTIPSTAPLVNFVKDFAVYDIPFLFANTKVADAVLDGPVGQELLDKLPAANLVGLAYWENGFRNLTNSKHPVANIDDFKGLKIRTMENKIHLEVFRALGSNPTPMAFTELFTALQQGTVDGQENPLVTIYNSKFYEVQKYVSMTNHVYSPFVFLMSKKFWDASTPEEQKIFVDAAKEARDYERKLIRDGNDQYRQDLIAKGMQFTDITPEVHQQLVEKSSPAVEKFIGDGKDKLINTDIYNKMKAAVKEAEAQNK
ncbi:TRAP transporter substrate-binding protein [Ferviditalea candida]|uniref:TRAP transporter substrate-binding protein n=1 Tax=Ferviditalea candida TaxID=3108399 RepID=A0ABU5ZMZ1_9BACL|nr:TRAP transporter substrate-binding protein [Paenibacillaceae bacterium T2]